jgi:hypothetical protein
MLKKFLCFILIFSFFATVNIFAESEIIVSPLGEGYIENGATFTSSSAAADYNGKVTRWALDQKAEVSYLPSLSAGWYSVSVWKPVHQNNTKAQIYTVYHKNGSDAVTIDVSGGDSGWQEIGVFEFAGAGADRVTVTVENKSTMRAGSVKFEVSDAGKAGVINPSPTETPPASNGGEAKEVTVELNGSGYSEPSGSFTTSTAAVDYNGKGARWALDAAAVARYTPSLPVSGLYTVSVWKPIHQNNTKNQTYTVFHNGKTDTVSIDMSDGDSGWEDIGVYDFSANGAEYAEAGVESKSTIRVGSVKFTPAAGNGGSEGSPDDSVWDEKHKTAAAVLNAVGAVSGLTVTPGENVKRGDFITAVIKASGLMPAEGADPFTDVSSDPARGYIKTAADVGYINGYGNGRFNPRDDITISEAVKIAVLAIGFPDAAETKGGYPTGYMIQANSKKLLNGVNMAQGAAFTWNDAVMLLFNALSAEYNKVTAVYENSKVYAADGSNMLETYHNIYRGAGTVNGNYLTRLDGRANVPDADKIEIDKVGYKTKDLSVFEMFARVVDFYYRLDEITEERELICAELKQGYGQPVSFEADDITRGLNGNVIEFQTGKGKNAKISLSEGFRAIYNWQYIPDVKNFNLFPEGAYITAYDNSGDSKYDALVVLNYEDYCVDAVSLRNLSLFSKTGSTLSLDTNEAGKRIRVSYDGKIAGFTDIKENDIVSAAVSPDGKAVSAVISRNRVSGVIESVSGDTYEYMIDNAAHTFHNEIEIDGNVYKTSVTLKNETVSGNPKVYELKPGLEGEFYLNQAGQITYVKVSYNSGKEYAYLVDKHLKKGVESRIELKLFTTEGKMETLSLRDKIIFNDGTQEISVNADNNFMNTLPLNEVLSIVKNKDGLITSVALPRDNTAVTDYIGYDTAAFTKDFKKKARYIGSAGSFALKYWLNAKSAVFYIPSDKKDDISYAVMDSDDLSNDQEYDITVYDSDSDRKIGVVIIDGGTSNSTGNSAKAMVITRVLKVSGESGDAETAVEGLQDGETVKFSASETITVSPVNPGFANQIPLENLKPGDVIQYGLTQSKKIRNYRLLFTADEAKAVILEWKYSSTSGDYSGDNFFKAQLSALYGEVVQKSGSTLAVKTNDGNGISFHMYNNPNIYRVSGGKVYKAASSDIEPNSKLFIHYNLVNIRNIIIYE